MYQQYGLGDTWVTGKECAIQPLDAAAFVLSEASSAELLALEAAANDADTAKAIRDRNALSLAWHLAGGDDCHTGTTKGKAFVAAFQVLEARIRTRSDYCTYNASTGAYDCPGIDVEVPGGNGGGAGGGGAGGGGAGPGEAMDWMPWILGGFGVVMLLTGDRKRARRR